MAMRQVGSFAAEPVMPWPNGARAAVSFSFDMDADSLLYLKHGHGASDMVSTLSYLRYGPQIAVPRLCRLFEAHRLKASFFVPGWCIEAHGAAVDRILKGGHELSHHGYLHEEPHKQGLDKERYWTERAYRIIERVSGRPPVGYRAPFYSYSRHTADIIAEFGFLYDSSLMADDLPYVVETAAGKRFIEIPVHWSVDDWAQYAHNFDLDYLMPIQPPRKAAEVYLADFEATYEMGGFLEFVWHPFISGRPARLKAIAGILEYILSKGDVWIATTEEIARHADSVIASGGFVPRVDRLPYPVVPFD